MSVLEYNAFGPWIYEIDEGHPLPARFVPYLHERGQPLLLFKIPREIERQDAAPEMDLYDCVAGAYEDHICILKRVRDSVETLSVPYRDIEGVRLFRQLLQGELTLYLRDGKAELPFNAVSMDIITRFLRLIRARYGAGAAPLGAARTHGTQPAGLEALFVNLLKELLQEGSHIQLCSYQPATSLEPRDGASPRRLRRRSRQLPAAMHLLTPEELIVVRRTASARQSSAYGYELLYLPLGGIQGAQLRESAAYKDVTDCVIELPHHPIPISLRRENRDALDFYRRFSAAR